MTLNRCAACGALVDGDVCDSRCETVATEQRHWAGREPCLTCLLLHEQDRHYEVNPAEPGDTRCRFHQEESLR